MHGMHTRIFFEEMITNMECTAQLWRLLAHNAQVIFVTNIVLIEISSGHRNRNVTYRHCNKNTASMGVHRLLAVDRADAHEVFS